MITKYILKIGSNKIYFGVASKESEFVDVFKQRARVYVDRGYIQSKYIKNELERDSYDDFSRYVVAYNDEGRLVGSVRVITCDKLPIFNAFKFGTQVDVLKDLGDKASAEISRLIVERSLPKDAYIPRNIIMIFMARVILDIAVKDNLNIGFAYLRESLWKKMRLLKIPFVEMPGYECIYPKSGAMSAYFYKSSDSVIPVYFDVSNFTNYITSILGNAKMFSSNENIYELNNTLYTKFLKKMNIL